MAWLKSHQELARHPKTKRFSRLTGKTIPETIGHLHLLWWWAMEFAKDGDVSCFGVDDMADAAMWEGDPWAFADALAQSGFVDSDGESRRIHDWADYAGKILAAHEKDRERKTPAAGYANGFVEFWERYPRHDDKGQAYRKYLARLNDGWSEAELLEAAGRYAERCKTQKTEKEYVKQAKTFLGDATPFADFLRGKKPRKPIGFEEAEREIDEAVIRKGGANDR